MMVQGVSNAFQFIPSTFCGDSSLALRDSQGLWNHILYNNLISFNERFVFFLAIQKFTIFLSFTLSSLAFFSLFWCVFSVLRIEDPLAQQDYLGPFTFPHLTLPTPSKDCGKQGTVQTDCLGSQGRPLAGDHRADESKCHW